MTAVLGLLGLLGLVALASTTTTTNNNNSFVSKATQWMGVLPTTRALRSPHTNNNIKKKKKMERMDMEQPPKFSFSMHRHVKDANLLTVLPPRTLENRQLQPEFIIKGTDDDALFYLNTKTGAGAGSNSILDYTQAGEGTRAPALCTDNACYGDVTAVAMGYKCGAIASIVCLDVILEYDNDVQITCPYGAQSMEASTVKCQCEEGGTCSAVLEYAGPYYYFDVENDCTGDIDNFVVQSTLKCDFYM